MSTIKVDTYQTRGGASEIAIDKLKGVTAAGSMLVVGEGGTVTTNLQQGLVKCSLDFNGSGTIAILDSFNITSIADNGTGLYTVTIANDFSNINYVYTGSAETAIDTQNGRGVTGISTQILAGSTAIRACTFSTNTAEDLVHIRFQATGDLA